MSAAARLRLRGHARTTSAPAITAATGTYFTESQGRAITAQSAAARPQRPEGPVTAANPSTRHSAAGISG